jgi:hypothetical protein
LYGSNKDWTQTNTRFYHLSIGPGEYRIEQVGKPKRAICSVFRSKSVRNEVAQSTKHSLEPEEDTEIVKKEVPAIEKPVVPTSSFKASGREHHNAPKNGPCPGQYDITKPLWTGTKQYSELTRPRVRVRIGHIARPPPPPAEPTSNQVAIPGSGFTPLAFPSPGQYDIAKGGDAIHRKQPEPRSVFVSKSNRFSKLVNSDTPGPCHYHIFPHAKHQSFHLNMDQHWA